MGFFAKATSYVLFAVLHAIQFILAITVVGLYGTDIDRARKHHVGADGKWVFALVVASLSALTSLVYFIPSVLKTVAVPIWSFIIFVLWIALFGLFGSMYIHEDPEGNGDIIRMKNAVWVDLANALLWLIHTGAAATYWFVHRNRNTRFTGRATL